MTITTLPETFSDSKQTTGRKVVASMFGLGIVATGLLYLYWSLHLMPFMPLQEAIVAEFPGSAPRVDGGQKKLHLKTPRILRIQMKVPFDPSRNDADTVQALGRVKQRLTELIAEKVDFPGVEQIELHVYHLVQEKQILGRSFRRLPTETEWEDFQPEQSPLNANPPVVNADPAAANADRNDEKPVSESPAP